ncbi:MAG: hypothetical protein K2X74_00430 [Acetobacteraceae bacterium]|nr:hypothetical protein [Acetobacteraceae bacterium]
MPDRVFTVTALGEPHQITVTDASSGNATVEDIRSGLRKLLALAAPNRVTGI